MNKLERVLAGLSDVPVDAKTLARSLRMDKATCVAMVRLAVDQQLAVAVPMGKARNGIVVTGYRRVA